MLPVQVDGGHVYAKCQQRTCITCGGKGHGAESYTSATAVLAMTGPSEDFSLML